MGDAVLQQDREASRRRWWKDAVIYEIYVRSFQDSNGDGVGDLPGVTQRLDHLAWLGIDALWLTPFYRSPMEDFGYDVTDHKSVDPTFGTLADFDTLVDEAHARGLRVIVDFIPNHTSHRHPWFEESRSSRTSPRRGWYIWADGRGGGRPPNNWRGQGPRAVDGGGWVWDERTEQWYLANFSPVQPQLDWANADVREAMLDALDFWLARGVDGVRVDMIDHLGRETQLRDEPSELAAETYLEFDGRHLPTGRCPVAGTAVRPSLRPRRRRPGLERHLHRAGPVGWRAPAHAAQLRRRRSRALGGRRVRLPPGVHDGRLPRRRRPGARHRRRADDRPAGCAQLRRGPPVARPGRDVDPS